MKRLGLDFGSTTVKCVVTAEDGKILYSKYVRHMSQIPLMASSLVHEVAQNFDGENMLCAISGSAGMGMASDLDIPFVQEVYATRTAVKKLNPETDIVVELGGEDAKIIFLRGALEVRMNGTCAGGTGAFIDQMAALLNVSPDDLNELAKKSDKIYTIASRCGVFAKSDVQPLINQGSAKENIAASIFHAVVNQTVAGLAQGREMDGNVLYLGGPLTFFSELRAAFDHHLKTIGICPQNSLYYVAMGAAFSSEVKEICPDDFAEKIANYSSSSAYTHCKPLFQNKAEYEEFMLRHEHDSDSIGNIEATSGKMFLGIDAGSTTIKACLCDADGNIFRKFYRRNSGNPVPLIKEYLSELYRDFPDIFIAGAAVTGYGEDIIKNAFRAEYGIVETVAHYTAAKRFCENVDFIVDIGGQDIKCFKIRSGAIDSLFLNEACSSGCGSFLQTFAGILGYNDEDFAKLALFADAPVDLGSRCTVFMNSSVKQAQKDGASIENISAGLAISVVKNALYKVIRCTNADFLGNNIVVQGGTFLNNAVLRAFEQEIGKNVIRPSVAGLMGAYGAALYAMERYDGKSRSSLIGASELETFSHTAKAVTCNGCSNHCKLTVNTFSDGSSYIAGNRCDKPVKASVSKMHYDLFEYKNTLLNEFRKNERDDSKKTIGIPMGLNMYELLPFWHTLFTQLGYNVAVSPISTHRLYRKGQHTIPSDTACYPAKLMHGHVQALIDEGVDAIFYPSMTYNFDENLGDNHFNCPVVAYYPKVIGGNMKDLEGTEYIDDFIAVHNKKEFIIHFTKILALHGFKHNKSDVKIAADAAYECYYSHMESLRKKADEYIDIAKEQGLPVIVLCGRPYHADPEINHGLSRIITDLGAIVLTEDSVSCNTQKFDTSVLNQWTYHSRLYAAAKYVADNADNKLKMNLVQLVSFGCGVDAVTTDETRAILEHKGKIYTQIKIDEISNLGAIKIRLRSLFAVMDKLDTSKTYSNEVQKEEFVPIK
ncbi:MAG: 2-hydroxyacyl-CoA dehydratase [Clostridia bacterium]|nr:2-hydroxyacyl-CoA dehydratase [Clostridia bacterium]